MLAQEEGEHYRRPVATSPAEFVCAWCQKERGEPGKPGENHGICDRHAASMRAEIEEFHAKRAAA